MRGTGTSEVRTQSGGRSRRQTAHALLALAAVSGLIETRENYVQGATITWANTGATFSTPSNWLGGVAPASSGADIAVFTGLPNAQPFLSATSRNIGMIDFQSPGWSFTGGQIGFPSGPIPGLNGVTSSNAATGSVTFANPVLFSNNQTWTSSLDVNVNGALTVNGTGTTRTFTFNAAPGTSFAGNINFNSTADFNSDSTAPARLTTIDGVASVTFSGPITQTGGAVSIRIRNNTAVAFLGSNSYAGTTELNGGVLVINSDNSLGAVPANPLANDLAETSSSTLSLSATAGTVTLNTNRGITVAGSTTLSLNTNGAGNALVINQAINETSGTARLFKQGAGTLVLGGPVNLSGTVAFAGGVLDVRNPQAMGTGILRFAGGTLIAGAAPLTVTNPSILLTNSSTIAGDQPITFVAPLAYNGTSDRSVTISSTALTTLQGGIIISSTSGPRVFSFNGTGSTNIVGPITETAGNPGAFVLNNVGSTTLASASNSFSGGFTLGNTSSTAIIAADNSLGSGTFTWIGGTLQSATPRTIANPILMIPSGTRGIGSNMTFTGPVVLSSTGLATPTDRTVTVAASTTGTFSGVISDTDGTGFEKAGAGTLILTANNTYTGGTSIRNGILSVASDTNLGAAAGSISFDGGTLLATAGITSTRAITTTALGATIDTGALDSTFGSVSGSGALNKVGSGKLTVAGVRAAAINVNAGAVAISAGRNAARTSVVNAVSLTGTPAAPTSTLDLADQDLIIDYDPAGPSPLATVQSQIAGTYNQGAWTGQGITSSIAAANASAAHPTALGFGEASSLGIGTFSGQAVDGSAVVVRYTYAGDATLDGVVNNADFTKLSQNFNLTGVSWADGDFNFDGKVNALDFNTLAINFGQTLASPTLGSLVPEPLALTGVASCLLLVRRRRLS